MGGKMLELSVDAIPDVRSGRRGGLRFQPKKLHADKAYDYKPDRAFLSKRGIKACITRRGVRAAKGSASTAGWWSACKAG